MSTWRGARSGVVWLVALSLFSRVATADTASEANLQYELGAELYKQKRYAEAIDRFIASHRLVPNANVVLNIVQTFEFLKRDKDAYNWYETYLALLSDPNARTAAELRRGELAAKVAVLDVDTAPRGAELFIDRTDLGAVGTSPRRIAVDPGDRTVLAKLQGFRDAAVPAQVAVGDTKQVAFSLVPIVGVLVVQTDPPGAVVKLDPQNVELGRTPLTVTVPVGSTRVVLSMPGFVDQSRDTTVTEGQTSTVILEMQRAASSVSVLTVSGNGGQAVLKLDGNPIGQSNATLPGLPPGRHRLEVEESGRDPWSTTLILEPGAATRVNYHLVGPNDRAWPGWRWVGYGVGGGLLVAGGIVGAVAVKSHDEFDANPSRDALDRTEAQNLTADILMGSGIVIGVGTLLWDLLSGPSPTSNGTVTMDR